MFIEFKWDPTDDPFGDVVYQPPRDVDTSTSGKRFFVRNTKLARDTLGQISSYAAAQLSAQFRTHIFSVLIVRDTARLLRWDRTGTIVTEAIEYNKCSFLADFFSRYSMESCNATRTFRLSNFQSLAYMVLAISSHLPLKQQCIHPQGAPPAASGPMIFRRINWFL